MLVEVIGGRVHFMAVSIWVLLTYVRGGKLCGIAATTTKRSSLAPEFPAVAESGLRGFDTNTWSGIVAPAATPRKIIRGLYELNAKAQLVMEGLEIVADTHEHFSIFLDGEYAKRGGIVKKLNLRVE